MNLYIPIILGTAREGRESEKVAQYILDKAKAHGDFETELLDVKDFLTDHTIPPWEDHPVQKKWSKIAEKADGYIIVTPEYNHGIPGELKMLLDKEYKAYSRKPFGLVGLSNGAFGGARMLEAMKPLIVNFNAICVNKAVSFFKVPELFDKDGKFLGDEEMYQKNIDGMMSEVLWYAKHLKEPREADMKS